MEKPCQQVSPCIQLYETLVNWLFPLLSDVWSCSRLPIDLILPTCSSTTPSQSKSSYVETWKNQMKEVYQLAF